jgi:hypothetical protein
MEEEGEGDAGEKIASKTLQRGVHCHMLNVLHLRKLASPP